MSELFDFNDLTDLSDDLQRKLAGGGKVNPNIAAVIGIIQAGKAAGATLLTISMITAVWFRMGKGDISQQALRNALNGAVKTGEIVKPSRQTYAVKGTAVEATPVPEAEVADETDAPVVDAGADPLA